MGGLAIVGEAVVQAALPARLAPDEIAAATGCAGCFAGCFSLPLVLLTRLAPLTVKVTGHGTCCFETVIQKLSNVPVLSMFRTF
jgi:hypothetical protein